MSDLAVELGTSWQDQTHAVDIRDPASDSAPGMSPYVADVLRTLAARSEGQPSRAVVLWRWPHPALDGADRGTVVILRGDEHSTPIEADPGCVLLKEYGELGLWNQPTHSGLTGLWERAIDLAQVARRQAKWMLHRPEPIAIEIPAGYNVRVTDGSSDIASRPIDIYWAGSIQHYSPEQRRTIVPSPKTLVRKQLHAALGRLESEYGRNVRCVVTSHFTARDGDDQLAYCESLRTTKIALAPRGNARETYRHYEAAMAGCVVLSSPLPRNDHFSPHPFLIVRDWSRVDSLVESLLADEDHLAEIQHATRRWFDEVASPERIADRVLDAVRKKTTC